MSRAKQPNDDISDDDFFAFQRDQSRAIAQARVKMRAEHNLRLRAELANLIREAGVERDSIKLRDLQQRVLRVRGDLKRLG